MTQESSPLPTAGVAVSTALPIATVNSAQAATDATAAMNPGNALTCPPSALLPTVVTAPAGHSAIFAGASLEATSAQQPLAAA